jgi:hypothetical protein
MLIGLLALLLLLAACGDGGHQSVTGPPVTVICSQGSSGGATGDVVITTNVDCGPKDSGNVTDDHSKGKE